MDPIQQLNKIKTQLDNIGAFNDRLLNGKGNLSELDITLLKQQCTSLYELIIELTSSPGLPVTEINFPKPEVKEAIPPVVPEKEAPVIEPIRIEEQSVEVKIELKAEPTLFMPEPIVLEKKAESEPFRSDIPLHEKIANTKQPDVKTRLTDAKVESLKAAINLNKKIAFVNELFKENTVEYAKAIDKLNSATDLNEALRYFNELKHHYSWNNDHELVIDLEQLIQKRFR